MPRKKKNKVNNDIRVVTQNEFNNVSLATFTPNENKILHAIVAKIKNKDTQKIQISFDEIKYLVQYKRNDNSSFIRDIERVNTKLMQLNYRYEDEDKIVQFVLFPTYIINKKEKTLEVAVNQDFTFLLNHLTGEFTAFALNDFTSIKSKYALLIYPFLSQWKSVGKYTVSIEDFKANMGLDEDYSISNIDKRVLIPTVRELNALFPGLNLEVDKQRGLKNKVVGLKFTFVGSKLEPGKDIKTIAAGKLTPGNDYTAVCEIFGYDKDKLKAEEMATIDSWYKDLNMSNEMIAAAYTAARDRASIRYCNGILKNWFNSGYKKVEDIVGYGAKPEKVSEEDFLLGDIAQLGLFEQ